MKFPLQTPTQLLLFETWWHFYCCLPKASKSDSLPPHLSFFFKNKDSRQYFSYIVKYLPSCTKKSCPLLLLDIVYVYCFGNEIKLIWLFQEYMLMATMPFRYIEHSQYLDKYDLFWFHQNYILYIVSYKKYPLI